MLVKKLTLVLAFAAALVLPSAARAEIGAPDAVPAATLLLPYFEVDLRDSQGVNTLLSVSNASATAVLAHVTLWTDESIPTFNFDIYLTGFDVQNINLAALFLEGKVPRTADDGADPSDTRSPQGDLSQDINFPGATGPCTTGTLYGNPALDAATLTHVRRSHQGRRSSVLGGCVGAKYGDGIARGYVTIDVVTECNTLFPSDPGYFAGIATSQNVLWGEYRIENPQQNFSHGDLMVHIESCSTLFTGAGSTYCPFVPGDYTFYGRYVADAATDRREPLPTTFLTRYANGGTFDHGTDVFVWRDSKTVPSAANGKHKCKGQAPAWFPLGQSQVLAFDEQENVTELCTMGACFGLETQKVSTAASYDNPFGEELDPPATLGILYLNLNHAGGSGVAGVAQSWVSAALSASGRYSVGHRAIALDSALTASSGGVLIPTPP